MVICIDIFNDPLVKRRKMKLIVLILLSVLGLSLFFIYNDSIMNKLTSRFITGDITNSNNGRMRIYTMYLSNAFLSVKNFVFGVGSSLISSSLNFEIGSNLHSSYLQIHSSLGILGLLGFFMLTFSSIKYLIRHKKYQSFCVLVVFLIRILTDYAAYGFITDILLLYYFYQPMIIGRQYE